MNAMIGPCSQSQLLHLILLKKVSLSNVHNVKNTRHPFISNNIYICIKLQLIIFHYIQRFLRHAVFICLFKMITCIYTYIYTHTHTRTHTHQLLMQCQHPLGNVKI